MSRTLGQSLSETPELGPHLLPKTLSRFEDDRKFHDAYRDHAAHQLLVYLLGLFMYDNRSAIKKAITKEIAPVSLI